MANLNEARMDVKMFRRLNKNKFMLIFDSAHVTVKIGRIFYTGCYNYPL